MKAREEDIQIAIVQYMDIKYPKMLYCATLGGIRTSIKQAVKAKATGYKKGVPDLFFYEPRHGYHGLAIELKANVKRKPTVGQEGWLSKLTERGYLAVCMKGLDETIDVINRYFNEEEDYHE